MVAFLLPFFVSLSFSITAASAATTAQASETPGALRRCTFPQGFVFGTSSAAYQYEGAVKEGGREPSIWDTFSHDERNIVDHTNGDVTEDQYHRYKEDVKLMKNINMDAYRFSISWSRIYPEGSKGEANAAGIAYYNALIDSLLEQGIQPYVTLYHWDLPQALDDLFGGWLSSQIVEEFTTYAETCFQEFGDRVKHWITFNEPHSFVREGYSLGVSAPGRCTGCYAGNSSTEPYILTHNVLLSHASAARLYKSKFQPEQVGVIGISLNADWYEPYSNSSKDLAAATRASDFELGWFLEPLTFGSYPVTMRANVGDRLPSFTIDEAKSLVASLDFLGLNHYTSNYAQDSPKSPVPPSSTSYDLDSRVLLSASRNGVPIGPKGSSSWLYVVPWGFRKLLNYLKLRYDNPIIIVTENGMDQASNGSLFEALKDKTRIEYHHDYLSSLEQALRDGVRVKGYFVWSLLDTWEWSHGFTVRFGLYYVDYQHGLKRYPKSSSHWFKKFLNKTCSRITDK